MPRRGRVGATYGEDSRADRPRRAHRLAPDRGEQGGPTGRPARPRHRGPGAGGHRRDVLRAVALVRPLDDREDLQAAAELAARFAALAARLPAWYVASASGESTSPSVGCAGTSGSASSTSKRRARTAPSDLTFISPK